MAVTATPALAQTPFITTLNFAAQTACTTRGPTATASLAAANITQLMNTSTNGTRVDSIQVNACGTSMTTVNAANIVDIWMWDGTTAFMILEIPVTAVTPSATAAAFTTTYYFPQPLNVPAANKLYASLGVTTTAAGTALQITVNGALY